MKQRVYLAGGFNSDWRESVKNMMNLLDDKYNVTELFIFYDPKLKPNKYWIEYGTWDIHYIKQSDIVFVYMENTNPSGYGLAAEMGYAKALNKTVILVLELGHEKDKYLQFLKKFADVVYDDLYTGIKFLKSFAIKY